MAFWGVMLLLLLLLDDIAGLGALREAQKCCYCCCRVALVDSPDSAVIYEELLTQSSGQTFAGASQSVPHSQSADSMGAKSFKCV